MDKELANAFKFIKDEGTYYRIRPVMEGTSENANAKRHANVIKKWFSTAKNSERLTGKLYRGVPFRPKGNTLPNKSFSSWTRELQRAVRFMHGSNEPGTIMVMNASRVPKYVTWGPNAPTFSRRKNLEAEVLVPPGTFVLGPGRNNQVQLQSFRGPITVPAYMVNVKNFRT